MPDKKAKRLLYFPLLIIMIPGVVYCYAQNEATLVNTSQTKYIVANKSIYCYKTLGGNRIYKDISPVFTSPPGFEIMCFDVVFHKDSILLGILTDNGKTRLLTIHNETKESQLLLKDMTPYKPWKIQFADVDGDGVLEICLGVMKESPLHPVMAKRLFIYNFDLCLQPKWRGSRLSKPLVDFFFFKNNKQKTYLISTESTFDGRQCLNAYFWDQFGFTGLGDYYILQEGKTLSEGYIEEGEEMTHCLFVTKDGKSYARLSLEMWGGIVYE